jgi:hypothetical protein
MIGRTGPVGLVTLIKLKCFVHILRNISDKKIAEFVYEYGKKEFPCGVNEYAEIIRRKLAGVCFELGKIKEG